MERTDNLTCEGCLHLQIKELTNIEPKHCSYCLRNHGESRIWQPGTKELLMQITDCYINLAETNLPTLAAPIRKIPLKGKAVKKDKNILPR